MADRFPKHIREDIRCFGRIVHTADNLASNPLTSVAERRAQLVQLERALAGLPADLWSQEIVDVVSTFRRGLERHGIAAERSLRIVSACRADLDAPVRQSWSDVIAYCQELAAPIGRQLLILNGEDASTHGTRSDSLCAALHILNKLCNSADETEPFQRLCIPMGFLNDTCVSIPHLRVPTARGQTRAVIYRVLDGIDRLLVDAEPLANHLHSRALRIYAAIMIERAQLLITKCRDGDPLQRRITLTDKQKLTCTAKGWLRASKPLRGASVG
jgi:phytoene/squalene synthetase